jgi:hypothetical protein
MNASRVQLGGFPQDGHSRVPSIKKQVLERPVKTFPIPHPVTTPPCREPSVSSQHRLVLTLTVVES